MAQQLQVVIGRVRKTVAVSPAEGRYIEHTRAQSQHIVNNMRKAIKHIKAVTPEALRWGMEPMFEESQKLVPVDTGRLKRSGFVKTRQLATGTQAIIGYGQFGRPFYALFVHEALHLRHAPPTQAKFLEAAVMSKLEDFRRRVEMFMRNLAGGSGG